MAQQVPVSKQAATFGSSMSDYSSDRSLVFERSKPGWYRVTHPDVEEIDVFVRARTDQTGALHLSEMLIRNPLGRLRASDMRVIPLGRIEAFFALEHVADWLTQEEPYDAVGPLVDGVGEEHPPYRRPLDLGRARLTRPDRSDPDGFYQLVAEAYRDLRRNTKNVAVAMAAEASVPPQTARRWIYEARQRGYLKEGRRSRHDTKE